MTNSVNTMIESGLVITKVADCPYREGTKRARRFTVYRKGVKVETVLKSKVVRRPGFLWDLRAGLIRVGRSARA